jgi:hypothetical protein
VDHSFYDVSQFVIVQDLTLTALASLLLHSPNLLYLGEFSLFFRQLPLDIGSPLVFVLPSITCSEKCCRANCQQSHHSAPRNHASASTHWFFLSAGIALDWLRKIGCLRHLLPQALVSRFGQRTSPPTHLARQRFAV